MPRKFFVIAAFILVLASGSVFAADAREEALADMMAEFANQPELTQSELDDFLALVPKEIALGKDMEAVARLHEETGLSRKRVGQLTLKIRLGMVMAQGVTREQIASGGQMPGFMLPSDAEIALIRENMPAIMQVMGGAAQTAQ